MRRAGRLSAGRAREGRHLDLKPATDLAPLREVAALAKLPAEEQKAFVQLYLFNAPVQ